MNDVSCNFESEVQNASLSGKFTPEIRAHIGDCAICQEIVSLGNLMLDLAKASDGPVDLPNARYIWWKAQVLKVQVAENRATRLIINIRRLAYLVVVIGLAGLFVYQRAEIRNEFRAFTEAALSLPSANIAVESRYLVYLIPVLLVINIALTFRAFRVNRGVKR